MMHPNCVTLNNPTEIPHNLLSSSPPTIPILEIVVTLPNETKYPKGQKNTSNKNLHDPIPPTPKPVLPKRVIFNLSRNTYQKYKNKNNYPRFLYDTKPLPPCLKTVSCQHISGPPSIIAISPKTTTLEQFQGNVSDQFDAKSSVPLSALYPEFSNCKSMEDVIKTAIQLAPCSFNINDARQEHKLDPKSLDSTILDNDLKYAQKHGLYATLQRSFERAASSTLQLPVIQKDFTMVSSAHHLLNIAENGVETMTHKSFKANQGIDCPTYPDSIADPTIVIDLIAKGHSTGNFVILPLNIVKELAANENLTIHTSPPFMARKRDAKRGRLVFNYSQDGPNHPDKKDSLATIFGKIKTPQIGSVCQLIENAHKLFPSETSTLEGSRRDIKDAFHTMRYSINSSLLCASQVIYNGIMYCIFSSVALMGDQDVNSNFNQITKAIDEKLSAYISTATGSNLPISVVATDDIITIATPKLLDNCIDKIGEIVGDGKKPGLCSSTSAISISKDLRGRSIEILGCLFDVPEKTLCLNYLTYAKVVYCMFVVVGRDPKPGQKILVRDLMFVGAHSIRAANTLTPMLPFSRSFNRNTAGCSDPNSYTYLTTRTCSDISFWRLFLSMALNDSRMLRCKTLSPLLYMHLPTDTCRESRDIRSIQHANIIGYSDACTGSTSAPGIGGYIPGYGYFGERFPEFKHILSLSGTTEETNINILELLGLITTAQLAIQLYIQQHGSARGCHIHIYCDNSSAISKARTQRSNHPIYSYLLYLLSQIQLTFGCTIGSSFHPGYLNIVADATSRTFDVPNGEWIFKRYLSHLPYYRLSKGCILGISRQLLTSQHSVLLTQAPRPIRLVLSCSNHFSN